MSMSVNKECGCIHYVDYTKFFCSNQEHINDKYENLRSEG